MWGRMRLLLNKNYYPVYLKKQGVKIGKDAIVLYPSYIDGRRPYLVDIGNNVVISLFVTILTHDASTAFSGDRVKIGRVRIHDHSFIGANSIIMCNVSIGPNSIVGAGSVVSKDIPPDSVYAGNPAKFICSIDDFNNKHREMGTQVPMFEGKKSKHAYIPDKDKELLKEKLENTFGYCCARLPNEK